MAKEKKTVWDKWTDFIKGKSKTRPSNIASYGQGMEKMEMRLPKSVQEQLKLVNEMNLMDTYPNDWQVQVNFFNDIAPNCSYLNQTPTMDMLGYDGVQELMTMYADLLLRPLSHRAAMKVQQTIETLLPTQMVSDKQ